MCEQGSRVRKGMNISARGRNTEGNAFWCPICNGPSNGSARYPNAICADCREQAVDEVGNEVVFYNATPGGTGLVRVIHTGELNGKVRDECGDCWVRGVPCFAQEHRFGGVVIQPKHLPTEAEGEHRDANILATERAMWLQGMF